MAGLALALVGLLAMAVARIPGCDRLGRWPGDLRFEGRNIRLFFPLTSCLLVSLIVTLVWALVRWLFKR